MCSVLLTENPIPRAAWQLHVPVERCCLLEQRGEDSTRLFGVGLAIKLALLVLVFPYLLL